MITLLKHLTALYLIATFFSGASYAEESYGSRGVLGDFLKVSKSAKMESSNKCTAVPRSRLCGNNPISTICSNYKNGQMNLHRDPKVRAQIRDLIGKEIYKDSEVLKSVGPINNGVLLLAEIRERPELYFLYFHKLQQYLDEHVNLRKTAEEVKKSFQEAIANNNSLNSLMKEDLSLRIKNFQVISFIEYLRIQQGNKDRDRVLNFMTQFDICGMDGLGINAQSTTYQGKNYLVLCPGMLLTENEKAINLNILNSLSFVIGHEEGHIIDDGQASSYYARFDQCMTGKGAEQIQLVEESADYWGALTLAESIKNKFSQSVDSRKY